MTMSLNFHFPHTKPAPVFSEDRRYRYLLTHRWWSEGPLMGIIGLTPSTTSDHHHDDTNARRFKGLKDFAKSRGFAGYTAATLYARVDADPHHLTGHDDDPIGPNNDFYLDLLAASHDMIVLAWGDNADPDHARTVASRVWHHCSKRHGSLAIAGWTPNGHPVNPLDLTHTPPIVTLTAGAHPGFVDVIDDRRWIHLLADTAHLDADPVQPAPQRRSA